MAYPASLSVCPAEASSNRRHALQHLISFRSAECCERGCVPAIVGVRVALAHDELRIGQNNSERESTSGRSTDCGTGHLIRAFHDIGRMFSLLFPLSYPSPVGHQLRGRVQSRTTEYGFVEGKNGFICVSWGTSSRGNGTTIVHRDLVMVLAGESRLARGISLNSASRLPVIRIRGRQLFSGRFRHLAPG